MATASHVIDKVLFRLEESETSPIFWSRDEILRLLNEGFIEFVLMSGYLNSEATHTMISSKLQAIPSTAMALLGVQYAGLPIERSTVEGFDRTSRRWDYQSGILTQWAPCGVDRFFVNKHPTEATVVTLQTLDAPPVLVEADEIELEDEYVDALEDYTFHAARFKEGGLEFEEAQPSYDDFSKKAGMREQRTFSEMFVIWSRTPNSGDTGGSYSTMERA